MTNGSSGAPPFVVRYLSAALEWVEKCCLLQLLRRKGWLGLGDCCTDLYVVGQFGLAAVAYVLSFWVSWTYVVNLALGALVIFYSGWRIIELVAFFLMQMIGGKPEVASRERSFVLALLNYFEVTFWFAVWYSVLVRCGSLKITNSYPSGLSIFRESLAMMLVNSSNTFELTVSWWLWTAMCVQSLAAAIKGSHEAHLTLYTREHYGAYRRRRPTVFAHACKMGLESIVSKRKDSAYFRALA